MEDIVSLAKRRGFVFPASSIYGGIANTWDYGPLGAIMKNNIKNEWIKFFVNSFDDMVLFDSAIFQNSKVWEASGHVDKFNDPLVDCIRCHKRYRADTLLEDMLKINVEGLSCEDMTRLIKDNNIQCPSCKGNLTTVRTFNLMFKTKIGPTADDGEDIYLRPETCQGIFINFSNILKSYRLKIPFGIAQVGKAFRNEITPGNFIFRTLEFEQLEIEYFTHPKDANKTFTEIMGRVKRWYQYIGIKDENLKFVELSEEERAHYSKKTIDIYFKFPFGFKELQSFANRGDYDLSRHSKFSGEKLEYYDEVSKERYTPYVIEPSVGLDRLFLALLVNGYKEEKVGDSDKRVVLSLSSKIAPFQIAVFPLERDSKSINLAKKLYEDLKLVYRCTYDEGSSIGKRYRRQDEIGTCKCITVDPKSLDDDSITVRDRDTMKQDRIKISDLMNYLTTCFI